MRTPQLAAAIALAAVLWPSTARAQAPAASGATAPSGTVTFMILNARAAALGGAWVTGRDQDVVFTNPAQVIGARNDFAVTLLHSGDTGRGVGFGSAYAGGKLSFSLGWGLQGDDRHAAAGLAGAVQYKGFKGGVTTKYVTSRDSARERVWLIDAGVSRSLLSGTVGLAVRNLGVDSTYAWRNERFARQVVAGYSRSMTAGPLDLAAFGEVGRRSGFTSAAAGLEAGYSWIEGVSVQVRAGLRRAELTTDKPVTLGAGFSLDRLTVDYALRLYTESRRAHVVTLRWR